MSLTKYALPCVPGNEVIDFQVNTAIGKKLTKIFQAVIDYRDALTYPKDMSEVDRVAYRNSAVTDFVNQNMVPDFKEAVRKEIGLIVTEIRLFYGMEIGITGQFAIGASFDDIVLAQRYTGHLNAIEFQSNNSKKTEDLMSVSKLADLSTGKFTGFKTDGGRTVSCKMLFDVNTAFLANDFVAMNKRDLLTAEEITAIMLHEIGHAHSIAEHLSRAYYYRERLESYRANLGGLSKAELAERILKDGEVFLKKSKDIMNEPEIKNLDPEKQKMVHGWLDSVRGIVVSTSEYIKEHEEVSEEEAGSSIIATGAGLMVLLFNMVQMLIGCVSCLITLFLTVFTLMQTISTLFQDMSAAVGRGVNLDNGKNNDTGTSFLQETYVERWADEYVARCGYGAQMASGLNKVVRIIDSATGSGGIVLSKVLRESTLVMYVARGIGQLMSVVSPLQYLFLGQYENQWNRIKRIRQDAYAFFKNMDIPGDIMMDWVASIEAMDKEVDDAKSIGDTAPIKFLSNLSRLLTGGFVTALINVNITKDYTKLQNDLDDMYNNPLYYQAARLNRLTR